MTSDWPSTGGPRLRSGGARRARRRRRRRASTRCSISSGRARPIGYIGLRTRQLLLRTYIYSPIPVDEALARVSELSRDDDGPLVRAAERVVVGSLLSMKGEIDRALELVRGARQIFADAGLLVSARRGTFEADIEIRAGAWQQAQRTLR